MDAHFILYVSNQRAARDFYTKVLALKPRLDVPGMTEYELGGTSILGLMPHAGVMRLLGLGPLNNVAASGPHCELYLIVDDEQQYHTRALAAGAKELNPLTLRDWGHRAAYSLDPDGHVLAFAETVDSKKSG